MADNSTAEPIYTQVGIHPDVYESFGRTDYQILVHNKTDFIRNLQSLNTEEYLVTKLELYLQKILDNKSKQIHISEFNNLIFILINKNPLLIKNTLIKFFDNETKKFTDEISRELDKEVFTIESFLDKYKKSYYSTIDFVRMLWQFDQSVIINGKKRTYSYIKLIKNYLVYANIINRKYNFRGEQRYFLDILNIQLANAGDVILENIIPLYKMKEFYRRLSHHCSDKDNVFNPNVDNKFMSTLGSNQQFVKSLVIFIHNKISELSTQKILKNEDKEKLAEIVRMISVFDEKSMVYIYYQKMLENRMICCTTNLELEKFLVKSFNITDDSKIVQEMFYKIEDIEESIIHKNNFRNLNIQIQSDKYKNMDISKLDLTILNMKVLRYFAWEDSKHINANNADVKYIDYDKFKLPIELSAYIDIFNAYYRKQYPTRSINWNYNLGSAVIKIPIKDRLYHLKVTTSQMLLLYQFEFHDKITANEMAKNMGISLQALTPILNSLLRSRIITRDSRPASDPDVFIYINENFYSNDAKLSLVSLMVKNVPDKKDDAEIEDKFAIGRVNILQAKIVNILKRYKVVDKDALVNLVKSELLFEIDDILYNQVLDVCIKHSYITVDSNTFKYSEQPEVKKQDMNIMPNLDISDDDDTSSDYSDSD